MELSYHGRAAAKAIRSRERMQREGVTPGGHKLWTPAEDQIVRSLFPNYGALLKALPHRTYAGIRYRTMRLKLVKLRPGFTGKELSIIRRRFLQAGKDEIIALLPGHSWAAIIQFAARHGLRRPPKPLKLTGIKVIDQIKQRCRELNYSMSDLDKMARTKRYFQKACWLNGHIHHRAIGKAVKILFGDLKADWK